MDPTAFISFAESIDEPVVIIDAHDGSILWASTRFKALAESGTHRLGTRVIRRYHNAPTRPTPQITPGGTTFLVKIPVLELDGWDGRLQGVEWNWDGRDVITAVLKKNDDKQPANHRLADALDELRNAREIASGDLAAASALICRAAAEAGDFHRVGVWLLNDDQTLLLNQGTYIISDGEIHVLDPFALENFPLYHATLKSGRDIVIPDTAADTANPRFSQNLLHGNILATLDAPIRPGGDFQGTVCVENTGQPRIWTPEELAFVHSLADLAAVALQSRPANRRQATGEQARRAKAEFLDHATHGIRTPLNSILGISEILLHDDSLSDWQRNNIQDIKESSDSLIDAVNDILDLSQFESGDLALAPIDFDFRAMIENIRRLVENMAEEKGLAFAFETKGDLPYCLRGDDGRIRQVLLNLLGNAIKHSDSGAVSLLAVNGIGCLRFRISDDRPPSRRPTRATGAGADGETGLGLSLCRNIVELMGGTLEIEAGQKRGNTFFVTIPKIVGDEQALRDRLARAGIAYSPDTRILIVDDNEVNLNVAHGFLETFHNLDCDLARSGAEAVEKAGGTDYHLVFMDQMMPDMDGVDTANAIRALGGWNERVPIVALTANTAPGAREMLLASGMNDYLAKPIQKPELEAVLHKWLPEELRTGRRNADGANPSKTVQPQKEKATVFIRRLDTLDEIDSKLGLENSAGQQAVYDHSLRLLANRIPMISDLVEELAAGGDLRELSIHIHGMKSSLASVGALPLSRLADRLENAAKSGDKTLCLAETPAFTARLRALGDQLSSLFAGHDRTLPDADAEKESVLRRTLPRLEAALAAYDHEAIVGLLEPILPFNYDPIVNEALPRIRDCVDAFDYEKAREILVSSLAPWR